MTVAKGALLTKLQNVHQQMSDKQTVVYSNKGLLLSQEKGYKVLMYAAKWMNLRVILLSERGQT